MSPKVFNRDVHADKVIELPFYYGFNVGLDVSEADVYTMLTIIEKNAAELAKTDPTFTQIAKDMKGFQVRGVESSCRSRAHPSRPCQMDAREGRLEREVGFQGRQELATVTEHSKERAGGFGRPPVEFIQTSTQ